MPTFGNRQYHVLRGSDVTRDGMYLELSEEGGKAGVAEVFYSDQTGEFALNTFCNEVPLEAVEWLASEARACLPAEN